MNEALGFAVIGAGAIGQLRAKAMPEGAVLRAVADLVPGRAHNAVRGTGAKAITDYRRVLDRDDIDAIVISSPPPSHVEMATAALEAGKHVLVEKPLATDVKGCQALLASAAAAKRCLATGFTHRYFPSLRFLKQTVASGRIGELDHIRVFGGQDGLKNVRAQWMYPGVLSGGGAMMDVGLHMSDLVRHVAGEITEAYGVTTERVWKLPGQEDNAVALLRTAQGIPVTYQATWIEWRGFRFSFDAYGSEGMVRSTIAPMTNTLVRRRSNGKWQQAFHLHGWTNAKSLFGWKHVVLDACRAELADFARAIRGEESAIGDGAAGLRAVQVADAVYESSRRGAPVRLPV